MIDEHHVESIIKELLEALGEDPQREGLVETPRRVAKSLKEQLSGYFQDPKDLLTSFEADGYDQLIIVPHIDFYSRCEHHLESFYGQVHIGYLPDGKILGVSKFARLVDIYARRLQIQERMTQQIADAIMEGLKPRGVAVVAEGIHLCMRARGVEKQNTKVITSCMLGRFREESEAALRNEFLRLIEL